MSKTAKRGYGTYLDGTQGVSGRRNIVSCGNNARARFSLCLKIVVISKTCRRVGSAHTRILDVEFLYFLQQL